MVLRLCWITIASLVLHGTCHASDEEPRYEYRIRGALATFNSMDEVKAVLANGWPRYQILEISEERTISETLTEFIFTAPPPNPHSGVGYYAYTPWGYHPFFSRTYDGAKSKLDKFLAGSGHPETHRLYDGKRPEGPRYAAVGFEEMPAQVEVMDHPIDFCKVVLATRGSPRAFGTPYQMWIYRSYEDLPPTTKCSFYDWNIHAYWAVTRHIIFRIESIPGYYCGYGYVPEFTINPGICQNTTRVVVEREKKVSCAVEAAKPLEYWIKIYHGNDPQMAQLTRDLENGASVSLRDMLTPEAQTAEACVSSKFTAGGFAYELDSTRRPLAYQAHFYDLYQRWLEHGEVDEGSPEWEACAERREEVELEMGKRVNSDERDWNAPGGRFHQIVNAASPSSSKHPDGNAFDVSGVGGVIEYLTKDGPPTMTVQDWVNQPTDCGVGWGGLFKKTDPPHFYLRNGEQHMEFIALIAALTAGMQPEVPPELPDRLHHGEPQWARLLVSGEHDGDEVVYHYTIVNQHSEAKLTGLQLGYALGNDYPAPDLVEKPIGTEIRIEPHPTQPGFKQFWAEMPDSAWTAPHYWELNFIKMEYFPRYYLEFWLQRAAKQASVGEVQPGQQLDGFSIRLPKADPTYYETGFEASFYYPSKNYFGYPEKLDNTAPELSVSVDKPGLWAPNNQLIDINVDIDVTDDYDGQPAIKLVSITANEPLEPGDIEGAEFGEDDRSFQLRASRDGRNNEGRIYTITYEATDAMANTVQQSVDITVAHDRRR